MNFISQIHFVSQISQMTQILYCADAQFICSLKLTFCINTLIRKFAKAGIFSKSAKFERKLFYQSSNLFCAINHKSEMISTNY